jgi:hypothetical protein
MHSLSQHPHLGRSDAVAYRSIVARVAPKSWRPVASLGPKLGAKAQCVGLAATFHDFPDSQAKRYLAQ